MTTGKVRDAVDKPTWLGGLSDPDSEKSTPDPGYEGTEVAVFTEWKSSVSVWQCTSQVKVGLDANTGRREWRFYDAFSERHSYDRHVLLTLNQANINV